MIKKIIAILFIVVLSLYIFWDIKGVISFGSTSLILYDDSFKVGVTKMADRSWYQLRTQYEGSDALIGEIVKLSPYGEYCPDNSMRGYSKNEIERSKNWVKVIPCHKCVGTGIGSTIRSSQKCSNCNGSSIE